MMLDTTRLGVNLSDMNPQAYRAAINRAIAHTGLTVVACPRNGGYSYFRDKEGNQVGSSVYVYRQNQLTLDQWKTEAENARKEA